MDAISDLGRDLPRIPGVVVGSDPSLDRMNFESDADDAFFELDDGPSEADTRLLFEPAPSPAPESELKPVPSPPEPDIGQVPKKIDISTVPEGGVDLGSSYRGSDVFASFDIDDPESIIGSRIKGRYHVFEFLGAEETGYAYLAEDRIVDGKVVFVRVYADGEVDEMLESILAEERVSLSHFSHPNIARFIDSGEFVNGVPFIVSEHVDGLSVADILAIHGRLDPKRASRILRQVSNALNEAHQEGILHRDIRPENIIIDPDNFEVEQAKLVSFGASGGEPNGENLAYKSPEVIDGRINTIVSDIYSLGIVAYEMLTGTLPFEGETKTEILRSQYSGPEKRPSAIQRGLSSAVDEVLAKALAFKPAERYRKAREFGDALAAALTDLTSDESAVEPNDIKLPPATALSEDPDATPDKASTRIQIPPIKRSENAPVEADAELKAGPVFDAERSGRAWYGVAAAAALLLIAGAIGWYYFSNAGTTEQQPIAASPGLARNDSSNSLAGREEEQVPEPRNLSQPPNTEAFRNAKEGLTGDLAEHFVGFSLFYPKDWKVIGSQPGTPDNARGKFLDISKSTPDGRLQEQMLISYYPSAGTFAGDSALFPELVRESDLTLDKILPGYKKVSEGPVTLDGSWQAYEVKFQAGGRAATGDDLMVWGRRLFVPAARPGAANGYEITMLATSHSENVRGADEVGVRGELGPILKSFEPSQN